MIKYPKNPDYWYSHYYNPSTKLHQVHFEHKDFYDKHANVFFEVINGKPELHSCEINVNPDFSAMEEARKYMDKLFPEPEKKEWGYALGKDCGYIVHFGKIVNKFDVENKTQWQIMQEIMDKVDIPIDEALKIVKAVKGMTIQQNKSLPLN